VTGESPRPHSLDSGVLWAYQPIESYGFKTRAVSNPPRLKRRDVLVAHSTRVNEARTNDNTMQGDYMVYRDC
jgi:hypothetical protein